MAFAALRQWAATGVALAVVVAAAWTQAPLYIGHSGDGDGPTVAMMQSNLLFDGADPHRLVEQVRAHKIQLLTTDELTRPAVQALHDAGLDDLLPYRHLSPGRTASGTGIWSSYPLSDPTEYDGFVLNQISATVTVPQAGPITVYAFHPVPPVSGTVLWADELSRLRGILDRAPTDRPVLVGGDFNATYDHWQYRAMLTGRFADAAIQSNAGHLRTYPTDKRWPPLIGIDHILVRDAHATGTHTLDVTGSDHRALVAQIRVHRR